MINALESQFEKLSDDELKAKTSEFRLRLEKGETTQDILPEAFTEVREGSKRVLGMRHFDVQLIGGMTWTDGRIAEMKTGEGKPSTATLACYLKGLIGCGVHVATVNDYLASRDSEQMSALYGFCLTTGLIVHGLNDAGARSSYAVDITYGTNNEFGFDFRDNMKTDLEQLCSTSTPLRIVDEVDSIWNRRSKNSSYHLRTHGYRY